jgi:glycosyltransferase involved in cell wall biosynthesis
VAFLTTDQTSKPAKTTAAVNSLAKVWIFQSTIQHYRLPLFDGLVERGRREGLYELTVLGGMAGDQAHGGGRRSCFRDVPELGFKRFGALFLWWPGAKELVETERPDLVVLAANPRSTSAWKLPRLCRRLGIPCIGWSKVHSRSVLAPVMSLVKRRFFRRFDGLILYGRSSLKEIQQLGYPLEKTVVCQNTIDTRRIFNDGAAIEKRAAELRRERGLEGRIVLECIGRMDPEKRHADLLAAWPRLAALDPRLTLVMVGTGPLMDELKAAAAKIDPNSIVFTGRVPEGEDYPWIALADVNIYPGSVGLAINQSLALGRPTVIADEDGADGEILEHEKSGLRYPRGDLDALVAAVARVLSDGDLTIRLGEESRKLMRERVTIENMVEQIHSMIVGGLGMRNKRNKCVA